MEFREWPKTPRLYKDMIVTEKIDGTNACVVVSEHAFGTHIGGPPPGTALVVGPDKMNAGGPVVEYLVGAQSRKRRITPEDDNFGFARWVRDHAPELARTLDAGYHYGEWWGSGIQRGYDLPKGEKRFALFNVSRYADVDTAAVPGLGLVPVLVTGPFSTRIVSECVADLQVLGSFAAPGYPRPEGVIVYHTAASQVFKAFCEY
ncbi:RNA ligase [Herbihabitans rhizosphaerae]|uniref:RNA ligase n=1 Tax=Herbihabitans rhizosphaerae TaxID=1872711 RepID=A0A4Q7KRX2_9PSEU|nr:RNA ligase family protein [Herbihabitans rhizosphaerae]RZS39166.1 RNA ligase [Herbihabitans rhizosphaerae]